MSDLAIELAAAKADIENLKTTIRILAFRLQNTEELQELLRLSLKRLPSIETQQQIHKLLRSING